MGKLRFAWVVVKSFRWREWGALALASVLAVGTGILGYVVVDAASARQQATQVAQAQRDQAIDAREAQSRRIDALTEQVSQLRDIVEAQANTVGRQEQAISDLATQLRRAGLRPVVTSVAPTPQPNKHRDPSPAPKATQPTATTTPTPKVREKDDPGLLCGLLPIIC